MSANKKNQTKTKVPEDDFIDSGCCSGPIDQWPGEDTSKDEKVLVDIDSGLVEDVDDSGPLTEGVTNLKLVDTSIPDTQHFTYRITAPDHKDIPPAHLREFYIPDDDGDTQLHIASIHGCEKSVATLVKLCPNRALLDLTNNQEQTPLHLAVMSGNAIVTRMLVRAGLSLEIRDRLGETPLHKATLAGKVECLQALLAPVPEHPPRKLSSVLNQNNYNGQACVHLAASSGHLETLQTLVFYGADINAMENLAGWTALHIASRRGDSRIVQYLKERCAGVWTRARDYGGRTPKRLARHTPAARLFENDTDSDDDSDSDDDDGYDDGESLFERLRDSLNSSTSINVA